MSLIGTEISGATVILSFVEDGFAHAVDVLFAVAFTLLDVDVRDHLLPACLFVKSAVGIPQFVFLAEVVGRPFCLFLLFAVQEF